MGCRTLFAYVPQLNLHDHFAMRPMLASGDPACQLGFSRRLAGSARHLSSRPASSTRHFPSRPASSARHLSSRPASSTRHLPSRPASSARHLPSRPTGSTCRLARSCLSRSHSFSPILFLMSPAALSSITLHFLQTLPSHMPSQLLFRDSML
jgi:hypothetical protein